MTGLLRCRVLHVSDFCKRHWRRDLERSIAEVGTGYHAWTINSGDNGPIRQYRWVVLEFILRTRLPQILLWSLF